MTSARHGYVGGQWVVQPAYICDIHVTLFGYVYPS